MSDELKQKIIDFLNKKKDVKKKYYPKEIADALSDENRGAVKKAIQEMTTDGSLKYWSSGSTTYVMLPEFFEEIGKE